MTPAVPGVQTRADAAPAWRLSFRPGGAPGGASTVEQEDQLSEHDERPVTAAAGAATPWSLPEPPVPPQPSGYLPPRPHPGPPPGPWSSAPPAAWQGPLPGPYPYLPPVAAARRSRRGLLLAGAAVVAVVAVAVPTVQRGLARSASSQSSSAGVARSPGPSITSGVPTARKVSERLLATMTKGVTAGDQKAFVSAAAWGHPDAQQHLRDLWSGLRALPLASFRLTLDPTRPDPALDELAPTSFTLPAVATLRLKGWDAQPLRVPLLFVVNQVFETWSIVEDRTALADATAKRLEPWMFPGLRTTSTAHVLVVGERRHAAELQRLAGTLERLVADVRKVWPEASWNGRVVAYATTSTPFVRSWYGRSAAGDKGNGDRASFVAKVATLRGADGRAGSGPVRLVLTPYLLKQADRPGYAEILRHEMTHVATARLSPALPVWLVEGAAEYTGFARRTASGALDTTTTFGRHGLTKAEVSSMQRGTWHPTLQADSDFYGGAEKAVDEYYNSAFVTCLYIADRYGETALRRLYERAAALAGDSVLAPALVATTEKAALKEVLHVDRARLIKDVGAFATRLRHRLVFR